MIIKRDDLYQKVWQKPVNRLAEEYGISGNGLKKICLKLNIPIPYSGYWRKLETKKDTFQPPLPKLKLGERDSYELKIEQKGEYELDENFKQLIDEENKPENEILVPSKLNRFHPLVAKTKAFLSRQKPDSDGLLKHRERECLNVAVTTKNLNRGLRIFNTLIIELEKRNFSIKTDYNVRLRPETTVYFEQQEVEIELRETLKVQKVKRSRQRYSWENDDFDRVFVPTGELRLEIKNFYGNGLTRIVKDNKLKPLENQLNHFIVCIYKCLNHDLQKDREWAIERKIQEEKEEAIRQELEKQRIEKEKTGQLFKMAEAWYKMELVKKFLDEYEKKLKERNELTEEKMEWIKWAKEKMNKF